MTTNVFDGKTLFKPNYEFSLSKKLMNNVYFSMQWQNKFKAYAVFDKNHKICFIGLIIGHPNSHSNEIKSSKNHSAVNWKS